MKVEPFDTQRQQSFTRRATLVTGGVMLLFGGIGARLYDLQVRRYDEYLAKADDNRFKQRILPPLRGDIVDRYGRPIATSRQNFRVLLVPEDTKSIAQSISDLEHIIPLTDEQRDRVLREVQEKKNQTFVPIEVVDNLSWDEFAAINFHARKLKGIISDVSEIRFYPDKSAVAPFVGHVGSPNARDLSRAGNEAERLLYLQPGYKLGKTGLEASHDKELRGIAGTRTVEVTAAGRVVDDVQFRGRPAQQGKTLGLTIDAELQVRAHEILAQDYKEYPADKAHEVGASAVVLDVETGDVLVMASTPSFDPNIFARRVDQNALRALEKSPLKPLLPKPLAGAYPPGSTFKTITAIAAQEAGISTQHKFYCGGSMRYGAHSHSCWKRSGHGYLDMKGAIKNSCDVFFYNCALKIDIDHLADVARRFGLGETYDLGIGGELRGTVPDRAWKRAYYRTDPDNQTWFPGETISVAIGQGALTSTPLQLAVMAARLASGKRVMPRIVRGQNGGVMMPPAFGALDVDETALTTVRAGMDAVVNQWGTAARSNLLPDYRMAGKTGTSQVRRLKINPKTGKPFPNSELPWNERDHALFVCFAPYEAPRYAACVVVEHGGSGSRSAGPRARDLMRAVLDKDPADGTKNPLWDPKRASQSVQLGRPYRQEG
ncbi:MAG: penicillin-binding protein 2 [Parvularcula sp.]